MHDSKTFPPDGIASIIDAVHVLDQVKVELERLEAALVAARAAYQQA
jgi:hypothetical protein